MILGSLSPRRFMVLLSLFLESSLVVLSCLQLRFCGRLRTLLLDLPFLCHIMCAVLHLNNFHLPWWQQNLCLFVKLHLFPLWLPCTGDLILFWRGKINISNSRLDPGQMWFQWIDWNLLSLRIPSRQPCFLLTVGLFSTLLACSGSSAFFNNLRRHSCSRFCSEECQIPASTSCIYSTEPSSCGSWQKYLLCHISAVPSRGSTVAGWCPPICSGGSEFPANLLYGPATLSYLYIYHANVKSVYYISSILVENLSYLSINITVLFLIFYH